MENTESIRKHLESKSSEELNRLLTTDEAKEYTQDALQIGRQILLDRGVEVPELPGLQDDLIDPKSIFIPPSSLTRIIGVIIIIVGLFLALKFAIKTIDLYFNNKSLAEIAWELGALVGISYGISAIYNSFVRGERLSEILEQFKHGKGKKRIRLLSNLEDIPEKSTEFVIPTLIEALDDANEDVKENIRIILRNLTQKDFGTDKKEWQTWWTAHTFKSKT